MVCLYLFHWQKFEPQVYTGIFNIGEFTKTGVLYAVFSGRDVSGNRGTVITEGGSINIDTDGPDIIALEVTPGHPIKNSSASPVEVSYTFILSEAPHEETVPVFSYSLSNSAAEPVEISGIEMDNDEGTIWSGSFTLPEAAGAASPELLQFSHSTEDYLGNISDKITAFNLYQVYQGELPPSEVPSGLSARVLSGGVVELKWNSVYEAIGYQLYRGEGDFGALELFGDVLTELSFSDQTIADGVYRYSIASVRMFNGESSLSSQSVPVRVTTDATAPNAPQNLTLELTSRGVLAKWQSPVGGVIENGAVRYSLYRDNQPPNTEIDINGLSPILTPIAGEQVLDSQPSSSEHAYTVTAIDEVGNESGPSNTVYLNFDLLPVQSLQVALTPSNVPKVSWHHSSLSVVGYRVIVDGEPVGTFTTSFYDDTGYQSGEREYSVVAIDNDSAESLSRTLKLPAINAELTSADIKRGVFNKLDYEVVNDSEFEVSNAAIRVELGGRIHTSVNFSVPAQMSTVVSVVVGGYADFTALESLKTILSLEPNPGESIEISSLEDVEISDDVLIVGLETDNFLRGASGKVRFSFENTSKVETEILMALHNGSQPSTEVRVKLVDEDGNVHSVLPIKQFTGSGVIGTVNNNTVARVQPAETFTSSWFDIPVPSNVPTDASIILEIDKFHYRLDKPEHVSINGNGTQRPVNFRELPYVGEIFSVTPNISNGDEDIVIVGRAFNPDTDEAFVNEKLEIIFRQSGYEQVFEVTTIDDGSFIYRYTPRSTDAGLFTVSAVYPGVLDRSVQGEFSIGRIFLSVNKIDLRLPRNYIAKLSPNVTVAGQNIERLRFEYAEIDQVGTTYSPGLNIELPPAMNLSSGGSANFPINFSADFSADVGGTVRLRLVSDTTGDSPVAFYDINYTLSSAVASIVFSPPFIETGVSREGDC